MTSLENERISPSPSCAGNERRRYFGHGKDPNKDVEDGEVGGDDDVLPFLNKLAAVLILDERFVVTPAGDVGGDVATNGCSSFLFPCFFFARCLFFFSLFFHCFFSLWDRCTGGCGDEAEDEDGRATRVVFFGVAIVSVAVVGVGAWSFFFLFVICCCSFCCCCLF